MVYLVKKKIKGHIYLYLVEAARVKGKVKRIWQQYLGPEDTIRDASHILTAGKPSVDTYDFGFPIALWQTAQKLDLVKIIDDAVDKRQQGLSVGYYMLLATINRCVHPVPKENLFPWFQKTYLPSVFPEISTYLNSMAYSNHFAYLTESAIAKIHTNLIQKLQEVFHVDMKHLFYDPTNFYTYMEPDGHQALSKKGHSKEHRDSQNIIGLALVCTKDGGIPLLYDIYSGNLQDATVFQAELPDILNRATELSKRPAEITLTFDKGNNSQTIFDQFDASQVLFIASLRPSMVKDLETLAGDEFPMLTLPNGKEVGVKEFKCDLYKKSRRVIVVYTPEHARLRSNILYAKLEEDVRVIREFALKNLNKGKWRKATAVQAKLSNLVGATAHLEYLQIQLTGEDENLRLAVQIDQNAVNSYVASLGKSYLITNHPETTPLKDLVWMFRQQTTVERAFAYLKCSEYCAARPIFHHNDDSIQGHLFTCVLGLLLMTLLTREVNQSKPAWSLDEVREKLCSVEAVSIKYPGSAKAHVQLANITPDEQFLVDQLGLASFL